MNSTNLIIGKINSGKTRGFLLKETNKMIDNEENIVILDSKLEYYNAYYNKLKEKNYDILVLNLEDATKSNGYNPLQVPYQIYNQGNKDKSLELIRLLALEIFKEQGSYDPFWENTSADYFTALVLILFKEAKEENVNLGSIQVMLNQSCKKIDNATVINHYLEKIDILDSIYTLSSGTVYAPSETRDSILSVMKQKLNEYCAKENLLNLLCTNDINLNSINNKTAIFVIGKSKIANIFINQLIEVIKLNKLKISFILDNFNSIKYLLNFKELVENAIYYNIKLYVAIIDLDEMKNIYGNYVFNKFENIININDNLELTDINNKGILPTIMPNKHTYFDFENFIKNMHL